MTTYVFRRPPRADAPELPAGDVPLAAPPQVSTVRQGLGQLMLVLPMVAGAGAMAFMYAGRGGGALTYIVGAMFGISMLGMVAVTIGRPQAGKRAELDAERRDYLRYLAQVRRRARETAQRQRTALGWRHPEPAALWAVAGGTRLWERRPGDEDFAVARIGTGTQRLATPLVPAETAPYEDLEPLSASALRRFVRAHSTVPDLPLSLSLRAFARVDLLGDRSATAPLARALVAQLLTFHTPEDLQLWVCASPERRGDWDWVKWAPHAQSPTASDAAGPVRLVSDRLEELEALSGGLLAERPRFVPDTPLPADSPHVVVVLDGGIAGAEAQTLSEDGVLGVTVVDLRPLADLAAAARAVDADRSRIRLVVGEPEPAREAPRAARDGVRPTRRRRAARPGPDRERVPLGVLAAGGGVEPLGRADALSPAQAVALARVLAPVRLATGTEEEPLASDLGLTELLGIGDPEQVDTTRTWRARAQRERLRVPLGVDEARLPVDLDLKESALEGMGPHGLVIGATGSGKSELLRTLVLGLAVTHSSETLNFVLVDFKGGATFAGMAGLPHTSAVITNLADDLTMVDRMRDALQGELVRRQELLRAAGNFASVRDYERAREAGAPLTPLPSLLVVCDEFSELLTAKPDFIDLFVAIGRLGRSLGIHLMLASQRLEEGRLRGLDSHLSYRIALRTFSAAESRVVLGVPDAYELPPVPGSGYLKADTSTLVRFKAAYVSGPVRARSVRASVAGGEERTVVPWTLEPQAVDARPAAPAQEPDLAPEPPGETVLDVIVERLRDAGPPAHQVWLPPLTDPVPLDELLPALEPDPARGLSPVEWEAPALRVPVGVVDKPLEQRRDLLVAELDGSAGHVAVVGGPQSGKSTLLRTLVSSLALTHTPEQVQVYAIDLGGGQLGALQGLPHVGGIAQRLDTERVRRTLAEVATVLAEREARFAELGIASVAEFRAQRAAGRLRDERFGDVFLVIDGWGAFRQDYEGAEQQVTALAARGLSYGVHVVVSSTRWADIRPALRDLLGTRFELRLGDPAESEVDRRTAQGVPQGAPGRGLTRDGFAFLAALPRTDGAASADGLAPAASALVKAVADAWPGPPAPPVRLLPRMLRVDELPAARPGASRHALPLGVRESDLSLVALDPDADPHFLCFGDVESGKTALLRTLVAGITSRYTPDEARLIVVDYRRTLLDVVEGPHLLSYATSGTALAPMVSEVMGSMQRRLPGPDVRPEQLRARSWWSGPELFLVVDDYDLVVTPSENPLAPLAPLVPQARDIGLHVVLARRSGGAGRALFEPVLQRLRETGTPGVVLSGSRDEGVLLGDVRPSPQPPGRGTLVDRRVGPQLVQVAWLPPSTSHA
ncbi:type VII secretion protein EccCa [Motilibacter aurantiacus]|uniref:type VII secretion protein EccCa n=1 Tax=Motilibacter aurantiacus TaxID=2714955 RepID=UPI0018C8A274|nr:type VII secretion protein EccCa [Motilibacter aurantiacus]